MTAQKRERRACIYSVTTTSTFTNQNTVILVLLSFCGKRNLEVFSLKLARLGHASYIVALKHVISLV